MITSNRGDGINMRQLISLSFALVILASCASIRYRNGNSFYEEYAYAEAIKKYEKIFEKKKYKDVQYKLADCYRLTGNNEKATVMHARLVKLKDCPNICKFYYAQALMKSGDYKNAKVWFENFINSSNKPEPQAVSLMTSCDSISLFYRDSDLYKISLAPFNATNYNSYSPTFFKTGIVFVSDRYSDVSKNNNSKWTGGKCFDLYYAKKTEAGNWLDVEPLYGSLNEPFNEGPAVFNHDYSTVYFTRNSLEKGKLTKNSKDINVLKIYKGIIENNEWKTVGELSFNNDNYSVGHPALSKDGSIIFFVSDMPWGYGGSDIYKVRYINGRWSSPENLGPGVNTAGNEAFPFVVGDTTLYYASDGRFGLGGMDLFQSDFVDDKWQPAQNLGVPVNSTADDFGYITNDKGKSGFFTSNRNSKFDRIYSFIKLPPRLSISGAITGFPKLIPLPNAKIEIKDDSGLDTTVTADANGIFDFRLELDKNYHFRFYDNVHYAETYDISTIGKKASEQIDAPTALESIILNISKPVKRIQFEKKGVKLRKSSGKGLDELNETLIKNPQIRIELASYTDSRGSDKENYDLTQQRADFCKNFLIQKGISPSRIIAKGYGETKLINHCTNGILCIDEEHEENNRIEFTVISTLE
ncbi:MAG: OmpA family protein [Bacteroidia bacterium]